VAAAPAGWLAGLVRGGNSGRSVDRAAGFAHVRPGARTDVAVAVAACG
jgi:hypothetical protein